MISNKKYKGKGSKKNENRLGHISVDNNDCRKDQRERRDNWLKEKMLSEPVNLPYNGEIILFEYIIVNNCARCNKEGKVYGKP